MMSFFEDYFKFILTYLSLLWEVFAKLIIIKLSKFCIIARPVLVDWKLL